MNKQYAIKNKFLQKALQCPARKEGFWKKTEAIFGHRTSCGVLIIAPAAATHPLRDSASFFFPALRGRASSVALLPCASRESGPRALAPSRNTDRTGAGATPKVQPIASLEIATSRPHCPIKGSEHGRLRPIGNGSEQRRGGLRLRPLSGSVRVRAAKRKRRRTAGPQRASQLGHCLGAAFYELSPRRPPLYVLWRRKLNTAE